METTLSGTLPSGLRPIARRVHTADLGRQTRRIVIPRVEKPTIHVEPEPDPTPTPIPVVAIGYDPQIPTIVETPEPVAVPTPVAPPIAVTRRFYLMACVDQTLLDLFPHGIRLGHEWLYIGRNPYNEVDAFLALVINRDEISKVHAALVESNGHVYVADLGSSNGTKIIRDQKIFEVSSEPVELTTHDILGVGPVLFRLVAG